MTGGLFVCWTGSRFDESIYFLGANTDMNFNQPAHALGLSTVH
jgi:hypothetical protein